MTKRAAVSRVGRNIALSGVPRSGTTLVCRLLNGAADVVAMHEPIRFHAAGGRASAVCQAMDFFDDTRRQLRSTGHVTSKQERGEIPDNPVFAAGEPGDPWPLRGSRVTLGTIRVTRQLTPAVTLCVKHPSAFTALLGDLAPYCERFGVVRNPLAVLCSWNSVAFPVFHGRAPNAERFDPALARGLARCEGRIERQLRLLDWFFEQHRRHLSGRVIRYEQVVADPAGALALIADRFDDRPARLLSRNASPACPREIVDELAGRLLTCEGAFWSFYSPEETAALWREIRSRAAVISGGANFAAARSAA